MEIFGYPIQTIYLAILIISGVLILFYMLFGDFLDGVGDVSPFLNPTLLLAFLIFLSASGYIFELVTSIQSVWILVISAIGSFILTTLLNVFILVPLSSAEESLAYTDESLKGRIGTVIIPVPNDGYGEVLIESNSGRIAKSAISFHQSEILEGVKVLVVDVKQGVLQVIPYDEKAVYQKYEL
ncbi:hypothetical protein [Bacillus andreraoultii]|uniref:hypothetical protein n=1 Tax=Bacillus andreraoultii TaxID=1499685 RepID=UPI00053A30B1|nr:hypothetical protein [Bacillus andreraoultii]